MIAYFPEIYPDELFYSVLARYCYHTGAPSWKMACRDIIGKTGIGLSKLYCNNIQPGFLEEIGIQVSCIDFILDHTMINFTVRFLPIERRAVIRQEIPNKMNSVIVRMAPPQQTGKNYMKYCPICVEEDRSKYGETYWHRVHQVPQLSTCPVHGCLLHESTLPCQSEPGDLIPAEFLTDNMETTRASVIDINFAKYVGKLVTERMDFENQIEFRDVIMEYLLKKNYTYPLKRSVRYAELISDFNDFFDEQKAAGFAEWDHPHMKRAVEQRGTNPYDVACLAYFLKVPLNALLHPSLRGYTDEEEYCNTICFLAKHGKNFRQISEFLGVNAEVVDKICRQRGIRNPARNSRWLQRASEKEKRILKEREFWLKAMADYPELSYTELRKVSEEHRLRLRWLKDNDKEWTSEHVPKRNPSGKHVDYEAEDEYYLGLIPDVVKKLHGDSEHMPVWVTRFRITKELGCDYRKFLEHYKKCCCLADQLCEPHGQYMAKRFAWGINKLIADGMPVTLANIKRTAQLQRQQIARLYGAIEEYLSPEMLSYAECLLDDRMDS